MTLADLAGTPSTVRRARLRAAARPPDPLDPMPAAPLPDWALISALLNNHGLRVSEVLKLRREHFTAPDTLTFRANKGGNIRTVVDAPLVAALSARTGAASTAAVFPYTYRDVYEAAKASGMAYTPAGKQNQRVTHAGRAGFIQRSLDNGETADDIAEALGLTTAQVIELYLT